MTYNNHHNTIHCWTNQKDKGGIKLLYFIQSGRWKFMSIIGFTGVYDSKLVLFPLFSFYLIVIISQMQRSPNNSDNMISRERRRQASQRLILHK